MARKGPQIPEIIIDDINNREYSKGKFLGKGGFAKCYEFRWTNPPPPLKLKLNENEKEAKVPLYAGKIVPKMMLLKHSQREKMAQEISLHRKLQHKHVVKFISSFQSTDFVFIVLELCRKKSLMELHKRRGSLTEPEVRYYMKQLSEGVSYLHSERIIHRDLKLGNIFLNDEMQIKIGDFGLATYCSENDRKRTLCGTPNYIAPEILVKKGHSLEVDIWSSGCIMYTLLVGKPPFETSSLKETYSRIRNCDYVIPEEKVGPSACNLISSMLHPEPNKRPLIDDVLRHEFIVKGYMPKRLPTTALTVQPRLTAEQMSFSNTRKPLIMVQSEVSVGPVLRRAPPRETQERPRHDATRREHLEQLLQVTTKILYANTTEDKRVSELPEEAQHPASSPIYWISKWVDYSDKYGIGYQLCDNSVGVLYNDSTRIILHENGEQLQYLAKDHTETMCTMTNYPTDLKKKVALVNYFRKYMNEHLLKAGAAAAPSEGDSLARLPYLRTWFRTRSAICLWLSNGSIQINWFESHDKIVICPQMRAVTLLLTNGNFITFKAELMQEFGITSDLFQKLKYARSMIKKLLSQQPSSSPVTTTTTPQSSQPSTPVTSPSK